MLDGPRRASNHFQRDIQRDTWLKRPWQRQHVATRDIALRHTGKIHRQPSARHALLDGMFVRLQTTDTRALLARIELHLLTGVQPAVLKRAGDDRAEAGDGEDAIYRQARATAINPAWV